MELKFINALKAGVVGSVALIVIGTLNALLLRFYFEPRMGDISNLIGYSPEATAIPSLTPEQMGTFVTLGVIFLGVLALELVILIITSIWAAKYNAGIVNTGTEMALIGAIAGGSAELIYRLVLTVIQLVIDVVSPSPYGGGGAVGSVVGTLTCCLPTMVVIGAVVGAIVAFAYAVLVLKK